MNDIFFPARLGQYLQHDIRHNLRSFGLGLLLFGLLPVIIFLLSILLGIFREEPVRMQIALRAVIFGFALFGVGLAYPSRVYGLLTDKRSGSDWLLLPAAIAEKFSSMMLIALLLMPLAVLLLYLGSDALICWLDPHCHISLASGIAELLRENDSEIFTNGIMLTLIINTMEQNILAFILGAIFFKKRKIVGVILVFVGLNMLISVLGNLFIFVAHDFKHSVNLSDEAGHMVMVLMAVAHTLFTIAMATGVFFRLKTIKH